MVIFTKWMTFQCSVGANQRPFVQNAYRIRQIYGTDACVTDWVVDGERQKEVREGKMMEPQKGKLTTTQMPIGKWRAKVIRLLVTSTHSFRCRKTYAFGRTWTASHANIRTLHINWTSHIVKQSICSCCSCWWTLCHFEKMGGMNKRQIAMVTAIKTLIQFEYRTFCMRTFVSRRCDEVNRRPKSSIVQSLPCISWMSILKWTEKKKTTKSAPKSPAKMKWMQNRQRQATVWVIDCA